MAWSVSSANYLWVVNSITNHLETKSWNNLRYNTVEEMVAECMPEETIDYVLYYDKYAIIFLNNSNGSNWKMVFNI